MIRYVFFLKNYKIDMDCNWSATSQNETKLSWEFEKLGQACGCSIIAIRSLQSVPNLWQVECVSCSPLPIVVLPVPSVTPSHASLNIYVCFYKITYIHWWRFILFHIQKLNSTLYKFSGLFLYIYKSKYNI